MATAGKSLTVQVGQYFHMPGKHRALLTTDRHKFHSASDPASKSSLAATKLLSTTDVIRTCQTPRFYLGCWPLSSPRGGPIVAKRNEVLAANFERVLKYNLCALEELQLHSKVSQGWISYRDSYLIIQIHAQCHESVLSPVQGREVR
jgi:hypothetical protein